MHGKLHENVLISTSLIHWFNESSWDVFEKANGNIINYWKDICCMYTLELPLSDNSNAYKQNLLLKIKKTCFEVYTYQVSCTLSLHLLNISNCKPVTNYYLFMLTWQLYLKVRFHGLHICKPGSCVVVLVVLFLLGTCVGYDLPW